MGSYGCRSRVFALLMLWGCRRDLVPAAPADPIVAEAEVALGSAEAECGNFLAALERYGACPNASDDERAWVKRVAEVFTSSFQAGRRSNTNAEAERVMARACHRAAQSVADATARCAAGRRPDLGE